MPSGFRKALAYVKATYNNPLIFVTENGFSGEAGLDDDDRIAYYNVLNYAATIKFNFYVFVLELSKGNAQSNLY